jgi:hypothetical protein
MVGGVGEVKSVGEAEAAMVMEVKQYVENFKSVKFESFTPVEMKTQVYVDV